MLGGRMSIEGSMKVGAGDGGGESDGGYLGQRVDSGVGAA